MQERTVRDGDRGVLDHVAVVVVVELDQEHEGIQGVVGAVEIVRLDRDGGAILRNGQRVALVLRDLRIRSEKHTKRTSKGTSFSFNSMCTSLIAVEGVDTSLRWNIVSLKRTVARRSSSLR